MAIIIDFTQMREVLESRPGRMKPSHDGPPEGEVVLFTGVRYERYGAEFIEQSEAEVAGVDQRARKK